MSVDPAWVVAGLMLVSNVGLSAYTLNKNGKSESKWKGQMEERVENAEKQHDTCRSEMSTAIQGIDKKIGDLHSRLTKAQGAE